MVMESSAYTRFADGASHHTQNSASTAWVIYTPTSQVLFSGGICLHPSVAAATISQNSKNFRTLILFDLVLFP